MSGGMVCLSADQLTATQTQAQIGEQIGHHDLFDSSAIGESSFSFLCLLACVSQNLACLPHSRKMRIDTMSAPPQPFASRHGGGLKGTIDG